MPPSMVKSIRDLIFWQYAKIIATSAGMDNYRFITSRYQKLRKNEITWSSAIREYIKERESPNECAYCGSKEKLTLEHILPTARNGPNIADNAVWVCKSCNSSKGAKRLYEWFGLDNANNIPRIAEGKYLKLLYDLHEQNGTLDLSVERLTDLCNVCDLGQKCPEAEKLTVFCLEGFMLKK